VRHPKHDKDTVDNDFNVVFLKNKAEGARVFEIEFRSLCPIGIRRAKRSEFAGGSGDGGGMGRRRSAKGRIDVVRRVDGGGRCTP